jgi:predicted transposase/invertase (TIGR01784 family)
MKPIIDPKVDCVFKAILGSEEHKALLVHFLNAVLARDPGIRIRSVELLNPYNEREFETAKLSVVDVKARDDAGRWYQIEIQLALHAGLTARMLYTWSTIYHNQLRKGAAFTTLQPVIAIWLLDEPLFPGGGDHLPFVLWNRAHGRLLSDHLRIDLLQLSEWPGPGAQYDELDRWLCLFREGEQVDLATPPMLLQSQEMKEAMSVLQHFSENQREYLLYQQRLEAESLRATWEEEAAQARRFMAQATTQIALAKQQADEAKQQADEAKQQAEQERQEKERLLALLKQAGLDPNPS